MFKSVLANGNIVRGYPIGELAGMNGVTLINPQKIIVSLPKIFILFTSNDQEDGMLSLQKQAGFTIVAKDITVGVTAQDVIEQVPRIVKVMFENAEVFNVRSWCKYDNLIIEDIWSSGIGHFEIFITE